jgi:hypothetical protein
MDPLESDFLNRAPPGLPGRYKSGGIFAVVGFLAGMAISFLASVCMVLLAAVLGGAAGWLGARWEVPQTSEAARRVGVAAGLVAGIGALLGSTAGSLLSTLVSGPMVTEWLGTQLGEAFNGSIFWTSAVLTITCIGLATLAISSVFGLLGSLGWYEWQGRGGEDPTEILEVSDGPDRRQQIIFWGAGLLAILVCCLVGFLLIAMLTLSGLDGGSLEGLHL